MLINAVSFTVTFKVLLSLICLLNYLPGLSKFYLSRGASELAGLEERFPGKGVRLPGPQR